MHQTSTAPKTLQGLVADLTNPTRENTPEAGWRNVPSLWEQLVGATGRGAGQDSSVARSRPPVSTSVLSLVSEIEATTATFLRLRKRHVHHRRIHVAANVDLCGCRPPARPCRNAPTEHQIRDIPADLRAIVNDPGMQGDHQVEWLGLLERWITTARVILEGTGPLGWLRGVRCIDCEATNHRQWIGGENIVTPALQLIWHVTESGAELIHHVRCVACGAERWPADFHLIAANNAAANLTQETLTA